jgi:hypothetical protein
MANFCSLPTGDEISEITVANIQDKGSPTVTVGLWGYIDTINTQKELEILAPPYVRVKKGDIQMTDAGLVRKYEISSYHPGRWSIQAVPSGGGDPWDTLAVIVRRHTNCPAEPLPTR